MKIKNRLFALALGVILPVSIAYADVSADMKTGISYEGVLKNAISAGTALDNALIQMIRTSPDQSDAIITAAILVKPELSAKIVKAAIEAGVSIDDVLNAAFEVAPEDQETEIIQTAIEAGWDPAEAEATATGKKKGFKRAINTYGFKRKVGTIGFNRRPTPPPNGGVSPH